MPTHTMDSGALRPTTARGGTFFRGLPVKFSWGSVFAGMVAALGVWILLYAFGLALGLSTVNPDAPSSVRGSGIFTGVWSLIVPLIALFVGGMVAGRGAGPVTRGEGAIHGLIVWGLTTVVGLWMVVSLFGSIVSGAGKLGQSAMQAGGQLIPGAMPKGDLQIDEKLLAPVNERLRAEGKSEITGQQVQTSITEVARNAASGGKLDRQALADSLARNTGLSQQDVDELSGRLEAQLSQTKDQVQTTALKAADATGKVFWGVFGALFLGLVAAMLGGFAGAPKRQITEVAVAR